MKMYQKVLEYQQNKVKYTNPAYQQPNFYKLIGPSNGAKILNTLRLAL